MDTKYSNYWEHLIQEIEPMMNIGESILEETMTLVEKYHIDLSAEAEWEKLSDSFKDELQSCISSKTHTMPNNILFNEFVRSSSMFQMVVDKLEVQYSKLKKNDTSARSLLQNLMQEVMSTSIALNIMSLEDWHEIIMSKKESYQVDDVTGYVYKKLSDLLKPKEEICIYDFFYNKTKQDEIDKLLNEAKCCLLLAFTHRELTKKRGQGMSRFIIDYIHKWQNEGLMKPLKSIFPFCLCLQQYWNNEINLGTRQGLEAIYKQKS